MELYPSLALSLILLLAAAGLMASHVLAWRRYQRQKLDAEGFDYRRRQFRRRMQTSAMLGLVGLTILIGQVLAAWFGSPGLAVLFWGAVAFLVLWTMLLAVVDMLATRHYFGRLRHDTLVNQLKLQAELRHIQAVRGNGKMRDEARGTRDRKSRKGE